MTAPRRLYHEACDHQVQPALWYTEIVKRTPSSSTAFDAPAGMVAAKDVEVPCAETGCREVAILNLSAS